MLSRFQLSREIRTPHLVSAAGPSIRSRPSELHPAVMKCGTDSRRESGGSMTANSQPSATARTSTPYTFFATAGEEIVIARGPEPKVRLVPVCNPRGERKPGRLKGKFNVGPEFFEPLPPEELDLWWK